MAEKLVLITGASSGIGLALARAVPWEGARVVDISRRGGPGLEHLKADLSDPAAWREVCAFLDREVRAFRGDRTVFIHSAGTLQPMGFAGEVDLAAYTRAVLLNSASLQVLGSAFLAALAANPVRADLVNVGSGAAFNVYEGWSSYGAGKAASDHWVRIAAAEQARRGGSCRIVSIAPGVVATAMQEQIRAMDARDFPDVDRFRELHDDGALRQPDRVAGEYWEMLLGDELANGDVVDLRARSGQP